MSVPVWSTACLDWEERIVAGRSLLPCVPLFPQEAEGGLEIFRNLKIVDLPGRPTFQQVSRPWVFDLPGAVFGAYDAPAGRRLIREFFELVSKKNGKSTQAPGIMLTALLRNWREEGEFYILAPTKEAADNSFGPAQSMVNADEDLKALIHVQPFQRTLTHRKTGATLRVLAADSQTVSGKKTIGLLIEELHEFGMRADAGAMMREARGGLASRPEGFVISISTQSSKPPAGVFLETLTEFRAIRDGEVVAPQKLGLLYEFPADLVKQRAFERPAFWHVTNPNLGASVDLVFLTDELATATRKGKGDLADFYAKHLNVQIGQSIGYNAWTGAEYWERQADKTITFDHLLDVCDVIVPGIDGGGLDDLFGFLALGRHRETRDWLAWGHAWCHRGVLDRRKSIAEVLLDFEKAGELTIVDDELEDMTEMVGLIEQINSAGLLGAVAIDTEGPYGEFVDELASISVTAEGEKIVGVRQGIFLMNAIKTTERKLANGTMRHSGSGLMSWCAGNLKIEATATAMRATKQNAGDAKIDPMMALFDAVSVMTTNPEAKAVSVYETIARQRAAAREAA